MVNLNNISSHLLQFGHQSIDFKNGKVLLKHLNVFESFWLNKITPSENKALKILNFYETHREFITIENIDLIENALNTTCRTSYKIKNLIKYFIDSIRFPKPHEILEEQFRANTIISEASQKAAQILQEAKQTCTTTKNEALQVLETTRIQAKTTLETAEKYAKQINSKAEYESKSLVSKAKKASEQMIEEAKISAKFERRQIVESFLAEKKSEADGIIKQAHDKKDAIEKKIVELNQAASDVEAVLRLDTIIYFANGEKLVTDYQFLKNLSFYFKAPKDFGMMKFNILNEDQNKHPNLRLSFDLTSFSLNTFMLYSQKNYETCKDKNIILELFYLADYLSDLELRNACLKKLKTIMTLSELIESFKGTFAPLIHDMLAYNFHMLVSSEALNKLSVDDLEDIIHHPSLRIDGWWYCSIIADKLAFWLQQHHATLTQGSIQILLSHSIKIPTPLNF